MGEIARAVERISARIREAARRCGRNPEEITLVAASKGVGLDRVREAAEAGIQIFGENRVQEARAKFLESRFLEENKSAAVHLIGPLQTNKVKQAVGFFSLIHSIDSVRLAEKVAQEAEKRRITQPVLIEVNVGEETTKRGISIKEAPALIAQVRKLAPLSLKGLMTLPPPTPEPEGARPYFSMLRRLGEDLGLNRFSMGMSADFEVAVEEGATWVRIGTAIFGERKKEQK
ncbi:YggS family pyridoxal phosphate-dependent enzyme [Candidatus Manganitrophus noduliformans]|uniref:Pyridoxal phosphate homeostasis protein n=1 Tax=Candidatus Manganitrophus noduliformans TaxID=2606439 RepID=A0A7X6DND5_9BACT|nr:YggS family pyridoxal phosphate-dependent enzyme [Candidatus Manganitrophus noduliformans]NKE70407.1 YggS family pyridoxal phosphate-dependent enzyme [Candidatus Manganitrophus noduliformans]